MQRVDHRGPGDRTVLMYLGGVATILAAVVAFTVYPVELGLAHAAESAKRVVIAVAEIDATLDGEPDFIEYSESLYSALAAHRVMPVRNAADNRVEHAVSGALDCYAALREAWQIEREGAWDPLVHGDPAYWRSFHHAVELPIEAPVSPQELRELLRAEAWAYAEEALSIVER